MDEDELRVEGSRGHINAVGNNLLSLWVTVQEFKVWVENSSLSIRSKYDYARAVRACYNPAVTRAHFGHVLGVYNPNMVEFDTNL